MRSKLFVLTVGFAIGCGGGSDNPKLPDAKVFMDAAIDAPPSCSVLCDNPNFCTDSMGTGTFPALALGNPANPMANPPVAERRICGDWFITFTPDPANPSPLDNRKAFDIFVSVSPQGSATLDVFAFRVLKPEAGNFPLNNAIAMDPDPNSPTPAAWSFFLGDVTVQNGMIASVAQTYWASMGSATLMNISEADGGDINGTSAPLTWREINGMTGADVPGGCTATMGVGSPSNSGFSYVLEQQSMPDTACPAFQSGQPQYINGMRVLQGAERAAVQQYLNTKFAHLWQ